MRGASNDECSRDTACPCQTIQAGHPRGRRGPCAHPWNRSRSRSHNADGEGRCKFDPSTETGNRQDRAADGQGSRGLGRPPHHGLSSSEAEPIFPQTVENTLIGQMCWLGRKRDSENTPLSQARRNRCRSCSPCIPGARASRSCIGLSARERRRSTLGARGSSDRGAGKQGERLHVFWLRKAGAARSQRGVAKPGRAARTGSASASTRRRRSMPGGASWCSAPGSPAMPATATSWWRA